MPWYRQEKTDGTWERNTVWFRPQGGPIVTQLDRRQTWNQPVLQPRGRFMPEILQAC